MTENLPGSRRFQKADNIPALPVFPIWEDFHHVHHVHERRIRSGACS
ncbi:hypothetical protein GMO_06520 [Gluconobacter morbifer G707]|uniref:Uncharacterized protein n=1 Tax=Gluconobacter morbifer G707 TaxID=1088869 RepID=G6XGN7_9PROT|nr:hypothetical protein GMO_06520 [Gluconobacter morbifer G707]